MRSGLGVALALAIACSACKPMVVANRSDGEGTTREPIATISLASNGGNDCSVRWNGEAVTQDAISQRGIAALEEAIRTVGGVANINEQNLPFVRVEAPPAMAYPCLGATLGTLQRTGFAWVALRPAGGGGPDARVDFLVANMPPPPVDPGPTVVIGRGSLIYHDAPSSLAAIRADLSALSRDEEPPPEARATDVPPPVTSAPNGFVVEVGRDVPFIELYALARVVAEAGQTATLYGCAGPEGPHRMPVC
ncbi:MAG TPA: hypothetical protein VIT38_02610 [Allosphingosinicella sp.]|jgi:hypothetical protein